MNNKANSNNNEYLGMNHKSDFGVSMYERVKSRHKNNTRFVSEDDDDLVPAAKRSRKILSKRHFLRELSLSNDLNDEDSAAENNEVINENETNKKKKLQNNDANKKHSNEEEEEEEVEVVKIFFI